MHQNLAKTPPKGTRGRPVAPRVTPIGGRLQSAMDARGFTREDLAARVYRTPQTISNLLNGRCRMTTALAEGLGEILQISPAWLAFGIGESWINNEAPADQAGASTSAR